MTTGTPFIPPLGSPHDSSPVIPLSASVSQSRSQTNSGANTPAYAMPGGGGWGPYPGGYPPFGVGPGTPYTTTPFIPTLSSPYTPTTGPAGFSPLPPQGPNGLSLDYAGYPSFGTATPFPGVASLGGGAPPSVHPPVVPAIPHGTPWHTGGNIPSLHGAGGAGPSAPPGTPWLGPGAHPAAAAAVAAAAAGGRPPPGYQPFGPPIAMGGFGGFPAMGGGGWGGAGPFTPGPVPDPWHMGGMGGAGGWGMGMAPSMGMGMGAVFPGVHPSMGGIAGSGAGQGPPPRASAHDRMPIWTAGKHYGPVLDSFQLKVVCAHLQVNPLISFISENSDKDYLKWDMLFPTNHVQRSSDPDHISWSRGREEPATFPRLNQLRIISEIYPWIVEIKAKDLDVGVTCGEVIEAIGANLSKLTGKEDYEALSKSQQKLVRDAYTHNRSRAPGVPGGALGQGMRRMDFLGKMSNFGGVDIHEGVVKKICGVMLPGCLVLKCQMRHVLTRDELKVQEAKGRAAARATSRATSERRGRSGSRVAGSRTSTSSVGIGVESASDEYESDGTG